MGRLKVLVIGDTILDKYVIGDVSRVSVEAPVPILDLRRDRLSLGGAANVAANIRSIGGPNIEIHYCGYGDRVVSTMLEQRKIAPILEFQPSTDMIMTKTRFVCNNQQLLRLDNFKKYPKGISTNIKFSSYDLVVVSDYGKGSISDNIIEAMSLSVIGPDSTRFLVESKNLFKYKNLWNKFDGEKYNNLVVKCNDKEMKDEYADCFYHNLVETKGPEGYDIQGRAYPTLTRDSEVSDVAGAGDVFLAGMAVHCLPKKTFDIPAMAAFGNVCAGESVKHYGTVEVRREWLK